MASQPHDVDGDILLDCEDGLTSPTRASPMFVDLSIHQRDATGSSDNACQGWAHTSKLYVCRIPWALPSSELPTSVSSNHLSMVHRLYSRCWACRSVFAKLCTQTQVSHVNRSPRCEEHSTLPSRVIRWVVLIR